MNAIEEISKYKNLITESWEYGKGIYDKAPVKTVSSSTNGPLKNVKAEDKEPTPAKLAPVEKEEIVQPKKFVSSRDKKPGPFAKKEVKEAWNKEMKTPESKKGMFKGKTKAELRAELNKAKDRSKTLHKADKPEPESLKTKIKELEFALRAKNKFGKVSESVKVCHLDIGKHVKIGVDKKDGVVISVDRANDTAEVKLNDGTIKIVSDSPFKKHTDNESKIEESADLRKCKGCGEKCKSAFCTKACKDEYNERTDKKKVVKESDSSYDDHGNYYEQGISDAADYVAEAGYPTLAQELRDNF